jgi:hypothetical protein
LALTFKDGTVLDVNLYNWSDWDMTPDISFQLVKVPEPATLAMLATGIIGLVAARRRQRKGSRPSA